MLKKISLLFCGLVLMSVPAYAGNSDFAQFYEIDLERDLLPLRDDLEKLLEKYDDYDRKFESFFDLQGDFEPQFYTIIASYGGQEKRIKPADEDLLIDALKQFPPIYYQYLGPQLFEVPGMSEKILNMPGIKETKNKFPTRIAKEVQDIENIEFLSPHLYFMLMPEAWPSYKDTSEQPTEPLYIPKIKYDPKFYAAIKRIVPMAEYMPSYKKPNRKGKDDLRTIYPDKNTLLTSADVKAVMKTIEPVEDWLNKDENLYQIYRIGTLLTLHEREDELGKYAPTELRDMVNPCARLVQRTRIAGKERELASIVAKQGFTLNEWGYTCDKVIHAYRLSHITYGMMQNIRLFQRGIYDGLYAKYSPQFRYTQLAVMQAIVKAYQAPLRDVLAVRKNRKELDSQLRNREFMIFGHSVFFD